MSSSDWDGSGRDARTDLLNTNKDRGAAAPLLTAFWDGGSLSRALPATGVLTIGRAATCDVCIDHASVSRKHAVLHIGAITKIEDAGSANGTRVAGRLVGSGMSVPVAAGEIIEIGTAVLALQGTNSPERAAPKSLPARSSKLPPTMSPTIPPPGARANETPAARLERLVKLVAAGNIHVLITGETGTGKEVVADRIRHASRRAKAPFFRIEAGALQEDLLERELFGAGETPGLFENATGGTVLIDEVSELPLGTQAKLLRVLERNEVIRVGTSAPRKVDVRFIAATNRDLRTMIGEGAFREDLYFRLNGITIDVPPLRERREQISRIAGELLAKACADARRPPLALTKEGLARLESYDWPGNVRELKNALERAVLLSQGDFLDSEALPSGDSGDEVAGARLRSDLVST
ncbi:MAG TPA: sigma 54-interacting transcriptional regulator, partial [Labilithrix sp.]|nr:sigma 54-interacting transcriptional regulator [Labilithrix sp.]